MPTISATWVQAQERATGIRRSHRAERLEDEQHMKILGGQQISKSQAQNDLVTGKMAPILGHPLSATSYQCYGSGLMSRKIPWPRAPMRVNLRGFTNDAKGLHKLNRHSGMLLAGIQPRATTGFLCGWIPAKSMPE